MSEKIEVQSQRAFQQPEWYLRRHSYNIQVRSEIAREFARDLRPVGILDIGCGNGAVSLPFLKPNTRLTLFDRSETMLSVARSRVPAALASQVQTIQGDFMEAELEQAGYDLVICLGVLPYVQDGARFMEKVSSLVKPGGALITDCTDRDHPVTRLRTWWSRLTGLVKPARVWPHQRSSREYLTGYQSHGFRLARVYRYCLPPPIFERLFSDKCHRRMIYRIFGQPGRNRNGWLGNESIYFFRLTAGSSSRSRSSQAEVAIPSPARAGTAA
jgi:ubiquinone/menaquinone biosynthesis C-methylase UbiE